jgi:AraC-like DNA-binding protein
VSTHLKTFTSNRNVIVEETLVTPRFEHGAVAPAHHLSPSFYDRYESYRPRIRFFAQDRSDRCDAYRVSLGMVMLIVDVGCTRPFEGHLSGQDIVEFHYRLSGSIAIAGRWGEVRLCDPSCLIWYQPLGCDDAAERMGTHNSDRETWISLYCDRAWLCERAGTYATRLLDSLAKEREVSAGAPRFRLQPQRRETGRIVGDLLHTRGDRALDYLYCNAKATELLCVTLKDAELSCAADAFVRRVGPSDQRLLQRARDLLEDQFKAPPRLSTLARRIGMNPTKLCALFKHRYGESAFDFVRRLRLERARDLLTQSGLQVRQVATAVGYRHHSTFTAAFTKHFGVTPKRAQRRAAATR